MLQFKRFFWKFIYLLGNLKLAIILLLVIATVSSLGTVIEQNKPTSFYEINYPSSTPIAGFVSSDLILFLGLDHIYTVHWFLLLLIVFGLSLASCTLSRQIPSLKLARIWKFFKTRKKSAQTGISFTVNGISLNQFAYALRERQYNVIQQGPYIYAYKGLIGKIGPILVHISIILILIGAVLGVLTGFMVQELVPKGEIFHLQNIVGSGPLSYIRQDFEGYIHDFSIAYNDQGVVDQFYSDIYLLDSNLNPKSKKTIFVNEPLRSEGITFYQTDWSVIKLRVKINDNSVNDIPLQEINTSNNSRFWIGSVNLNEKNRLLVVLQDLTGKYLIYDFDKKLLGESEVGHKIFVKGDKFRIQSITPSSGIQIKCDPGIPLVYVGFFFLIFSTLFSYKSYFQIWVMKKNDDMYFYGDTNRAIYFFEKSILEIIDLLKNEKVNIEKNLNSYKFK
jgi:cytochrome c biogenesis protein